MIKKYLILVLVVSGLILAWPVLAKNDKNPEIDLNSSTLPEQEGVYSIKNHPEMKLRVFVRHAKPNPNPTPTIELICPLADPSSSAIVDGAGWKLPGNSWVYQLNLSSVPISVGTDNLVTIAEKSYDVWKQAINGMVTFQRGPDTLVDKAQKDGQNIIAWGVAPSSALAVSYIWYSLGLANEVDTIMNKNFTWYWSNSNTCAYSNAYDAQNILTHELGHTMGLDDEYKKNFSNNTMYGYGSTKEVKKNTLTNGDILGVQLLYQ